MKIQCPSCQQAPPSDQINISTDLAFCPSCSQAFKISESSAPTHVDQDYIYDPPRGAWFDEDGGSVTIGATTRSFIAFFLVPFTLVWAGGSLGGIYGTQLVSGQFNPFMSLFGLPFLIGSIFLITMSLMSLCGKYEVTIDGPESAVFLGIGSIGWRRKFDWAGVTSISETNWGARNSNNSGRAILVEGKRRIRFGNNLNEERLGYILGVMQYFKASA